MNDMIWTPTLVEARLVEAAAVLQRLPEPRVRGYFNTWPAHTYEFSDLVEQALKPMAPSAPSPATIARMEETLSWTIGLDAVDGKIVWMRAHSVAWKVICWKVGLRRSAAHERWHYALSVIAMKLNNQTVPRNRSRRYVIDRVRDLASVGLR